MAAFSSNLPACSVARTVEPKRRKVSESEKNLRLAQKELARIKVLQSACQSVLTLSWSTGLAVVAALLHGASSPVGAHLSQSRLYLIAGRSCFLVCPAGPAADSVLREDH